MDKTVTGLSNLETKVHIPGVAAVIATGQRQASHRGVLKSVLQQATCHFEVVMDGDSSDPARESGKDRKFHSRYALP
jgi:hypothetical protein